MNSCPHPAFGPDPEGGDPEEANGLVLATMTDGTYYVMCFDCGLYAEVTEEEYMRGRKRYHGDPFD